MDEIVTTDLGDFGWRELKIAAELLTAMVEQGLPENFSDDKVTVAMNKESGYVFLTNADYEAAMMNGDKLEMWYVCGECGNEGFAEDIDWNADDGLCGECAAERLKEDDENE